MKRAGFSLIELLIVIVIIAVLAAFLFPALNSARERSRQAACANNLGQIGKSLSIYIDDWDEIFPDLKSAPLKITLDPYLKTRSVWLCPSNPVGTASPWSYVSYQGSGPKSNSLSWTNWPNIPYSYEPSYALFTGEYGIVSDDSSLAYPPRSLQDVPNPTDTIALYECVFGSGFPHYWSQFLKPNARYLSYGSGEADLGKLLPTWHHGGGNWLFMDGHVKWMKPIQTLTPKSLWVPTEYEYPTVWNLNTDKVVTILYLFPQYR
jgi:prepilin-type N-terminal cleavage/methylation domain-containing protein/prepilin-type processing-associated H-X9-DG protein